MDKIMSRFERWILKGIAQRAVIQGDHRIKIVSFYKILVNCAREEFTEDNKITLDSFLQECHDEALEPPK